MTTPVSTQLWPQPIPIIGGTGEYQSGKTRFGVSICPGPATLVYDFEQSSASYEYIGFERIDVQKEMHALFPKGYKPVDLWLWFLKHVRDIPAGKYRVIMIDPATDIERGLTDWVAANPAFFGHTFGQYAKMSGIMWGDVKDYLKMILADICARCETFYFTAHVGQEFKGGEATDKKKAKGKTTLQELASLYLWFDRTPNAKGERPNAPRAKVIKGRLEVGSVVDGEVVAWSVLPPVLPEATPKAIRGYFANPAGKKRELDAAERFVEEKLSDDDRLKLQAEIAAANRDAAQAQLEMQGGRAAAGIASVGEGSSTAAADAVATEEKADPEKQLAAELDSAENEGQLNIVKTRIASTFAAGDPARTRLGVKFKAKSEHLKSGAANGAASAAAT